LDFYLIILFLFTGMLLGFFLDEKNYFVKFSDLITKIGLVVLLLAMGANLGSNEQIFMQLGKIGFQAFIFAAVSIIFSVLAVIIFVKIMDLNNLLLRDDPDTEAEIKDESADNTMTILIFSSVVLGILAGYFLLHDGGTLFLDSITNYSLVFLLFGVCIDICSSLYII